MELFFLKSRGVESCTSPPPPWWGINIKLMGKVIKLVREAVGGEGGRMAGFKWGRTREGEKWGEIISSCMQLYTPLTKSVI